MDHDLSHGGKVQPKIIPVLILAAFPTSAFKKERRKMWVILEDCVIGFYERS